MTHGMRAPRPRRDFMPGLVPAITKQTSLKCLFEARAAFRGGLRDATRLLLQQRTGAFFRRDKGVLARNVLHQLLVVPRATRLGREFDLDEIHVVDQRAVVAQGGVAREEIVDRQAAASSRLVSDAEPVQTNIMTTDEARSTPMTRLKVRAAGGFFRADSSEEPSRSQAVRLGMQQIRNNPASSAASITMREELELK